MNHSQAKADKWMKPVLIAAGIYNTMWGALIVCFPLAPFRWFGMEPPNYPEIWQCVGMVVGVYGVGYAIAAFDPINHYPIVLVGLLGKLFGPLGFLFAVFKGRLPWAFGWINLTNDLIWWIPFTIILYRAYQFHRQKT
jgi:small multidrug resistance pump